MKRTHKQLQSFFFAISILLISSNSFAEKLTTIFATDNSFAGNTFDVTNISQTAIIIDSFEVNIGDSDPIAKTVDIYYTAGTSVGVENTASAWTLLGSDTNVLSNGVDIATPVNVGGLVIPPGQSFGIYVDFATYDGGDSIAYTNGGPNVFSDTNIQITTNTGQSSPAFSGSFTPRQWNGSIIYSLASPASIPSVSFTGLLLLISMLGIYGLRSKNNRYNS